jgi:hypothetical protein
MSKIKCSTALKFEKNHPILWRFEMVYNRGYRSETMVAQPSWDMLRSRHYCKVSEYAKSGISHGKAWEDSKVNRLHTLRISVEYAAALKRRPGPKGRRSSRVLGATPDDSFIQRGQRPNGLPHQLRGEMNKLFQCEPRFLQRLLRESMGYKSPKKKRVNLLMPDLSVAIEEVYREMIRRDNDLRFHPAFKRMWAPAICRLIELKWLHQEKAKEKSFSESQ